MMVSELALRVAMRTYPKSYRVDHGDEMVDTALDLGGGHARWREVCGLVAGGVRTRSLQATSGSRRATWLSGVRIALYLSLASIVAEVVVVALVGPRADLSSDQLSVMFVSTAVLFGSVGLSLLLRRARLTAAVATVAGVVAWFWGPPMPRLDFIVITSAYLAMIWLVALAAPARPLIPQMLGWVVAVSGAAFVIGNFFVAQDLLALAVTVAALIAARFDPRLLAGMATYWLVEMIVGLPRMLSLLGDGHGGFAYGVGAVIAVNTFIVVVCFASVIVATRPQAA